MTVKLNLKENYQIVLHKPHPKQKEFIDSPAKRKVIKAGRRSGKTQGMAIADTNYFLNGRRVLYGAPTIEQVDKYWKLVCRYLQPLIESGLYKKNETEKYIESIKNPENRIKARTCWSADMLRGDYADKLTLDEWQLMAEDTWTDVGQPMLLDNNGDATFIYTPPSLHSSGVSRARDPRHASKMFKEAQMDTTGRWETFHFTSYDNPHISKEALVEASRDMSPDSFRREILAEDDEIELSWLVYGAFNSACKVDRFEIPKNWLVYSGHDFGASNPAALFLAQDASTGNFYIFNEYTPGGGKSAYEHVLEFKRITEGYRVIKSVGGNLTTEGEIRQAYTAHGWSILPPKYGKINAQIDRVISLMRLNKLFIFNDMLGLIGEISNCLWGLDNEGMVTNKIKNEARYHRLSCLRYIGSDFTPETVESRKPRQKSSI